MSDGYNGWSNYETWNVALWMDNDGSDAYWRERAQECFDATDEDDTTEARKAEATNDLAKEIQAQHEEGMPELSGTFADLLGAALSSVNWYEIAEHMIDDIEIPEAEEEETEE